MSDHVTKLYDANGALIGVLLSPEAWQVARPGVEKTFAPVAEESEPTERLKDWEALKACWDFPYPVDTDVQCQSCGSSTRDFAADEPRKFLLTAASLSGLVSFYCRQCKAKVVKRHFKDEVVSETKPFAESKTYRSEAKHPS